jgi:hypothetical protein
MLVTLAGLTTLLRRVQVLNAELSMLVTLLEIV